MWPVKAEPFVFFWGFVWKIKGWVMFCHLQYFFLLWRLLIVSSQWVSTLTCGFSHEARKVTAFQDVSSAPQLNVVWDGWWWWTVLPGFHCVYIVICLRHIFYKSSSQHCKLVVLWSTSCRNRLHFTSLLSNNVVTCSIMLYLMLCGEIKQWYL